MSELEGAVLRVPVTKLERADAPAPHRDAPYEQQGDVPAGCVLVAGEILQNRPRALRGEDGVVRLLVLRGRRDANTVRECLGNALDVGDAIEELLDRRPSPYIVIMLQGS